MGGERTFSVDRGHARSIMVTMTYKTEPGGSPYWLSVFVGAFVGVTLQLVLTAWRDQFDTSELWVVLVLILAYGLFAVPFVALGLAIFGLPLSGLLRRYAQDWWVGLVAAAWGAVAGKLMFLAIDRLIFFSLHDIDKVALIDLGVIYGVPTGLSWWVFYRRKLARR